MKLRNKTTGEVGEPRYENHALYIDTEGGFTYWIRTIAELYEKWEDYDEKAEKEAIAMLKQLSEAIDRMNANIAKICGNFTIFGKGKK